MTFFERLTRQSLLAGLALIDWRLDAKKTILYTIHTMCGCKGYNPYHIGHIFSSCFSLQVEVDIPYLNVDVGYLRLLLSRRWARTPTACRSVFPRFHHGRKHLKCVNWSSFQSKGGMAMNQAFAKHPPSFHDVILGRLKWFVMKNQSYRHTGINRNLPLASLDGQNLEDCEATWGGGQTI